MARNKALADETLGCMQGAESPIPTREIPTVNGEERTDAAVEVAPPAICRV